MLFAALAVTGALSPAAAPAPDDQTLLTVSTPDLGPGRYTVRLRVLSVDSHVVEAGFAFTVKAASR
jgi:hypothetical protein